MPWLSKTVDYRVCFTDYLSLKFLETEGGGAVMLAAASVEEGTTRKNFQIHKLSL